MTFMWGGGPGSAAIGTHMSFGLKRVETQAGVDNQLTLLTVSDLVFARSRGHGLQPARQARARR